MILWEGRRQARFNECDPQGFLFYSQVFNWSHEALESFWTNHQRRWNFWFQNPEWAVPLRHSEAEYLQPVLAGKEYATQLSIGKIGTTSVNLVFKISAPQSVEMVRVSTTHVFIDRVNLKPISVPESVVNIFGM